MNELPNLSDIQKIMAEAHKNARRLQRADELEEISVFIAEASLQECKIIIDDLTDRVAAIVGLAPELEDAAAFINRCIMGEAADEAPNNPMALFSHLRATGRGV